VRLAAQTIHNSPQDLARVVAAVPAHSTGIDLHPSGLIDSGHSPVEAIESLGPHILHVHACDAVRDPTTRRTTEVELGRGSADFPEILGRLSEFNYGGWVTIERHESPNPIPEIENAVAYLRSL
jgi:sugar phosphate isomerase/epimerase